MKWKIVASLMLNVVVLIFGYQLFIQKPISGPFFEIYKVIPKTVGEVGGENISYHEYGVMVRFMEGHGVADAELAALEKLAHGIRLERLAEEVGVEYDAEDIPEKPEGFELEDGYYQEHIGLPFLLETLLAEEIYNEPTLQIGVNKQVDQIKAQYEEGVPFGDLAVQYSVDSSAIIGGELGIASDAGLTELGIEGIRYDKLEIVEEERSVFIYELYEKIEKVPIIAEVLEVDVEEGSGEGSSETTEEVVNDSEPEILGYRETSLGDALRMIELEKDGLAKIMEFYRTELPLTRR